ncbi:MAG: hypothetical protein OXC44_01665 [Proteobacteria bacterium]|nr:hypothetical protein [Pseudomonadota bacterium]
MFVTTHPKVDSKTDLPFMLKFLKCLWYSKHSEWLFLDLFGKIFANIRVVICISAIIMALILPYKYGYSGPATAAVNPLRYSLNYHLSNTFSQLVKHIPKHYMALFGGGLLLSAYGVYRYQSSALDQKQSLFSEAVERPLTSLNSINSINKPLSDDGYVLKMQSSSYEDHQEPPDRGDGGHSLAVPPSKEGDEPNEVVALHLSPWQRFQQARLGEHYYDNVAGFKSHPEMLSLLNQYFILDEQKVFYHLVHLATADKEPLFNASQLEKWEKHLLSKFIHLQLVSFKELHLFLRTLMPQHITTPLPKVVAHYQVSMAEWRSRETYILSLLKDFREDSPRRFGPVRDKIVTIKDAISFVESLSASELQARVAQIEIEGLILADSIDISQVSSEDVINFIQSLDNTEFKKIFIGHILSLTDKSISQELSQRSVVHRLVLKRQFFKYLQKIHQSSHLGTTQTQRLLALKSDLSELTHKQLISSLLKTTIKGKRALSYSHAQNVSKEDVMKFFDSLKTVIEQDVFLHLVLKGEEDQIEEVGSRYDIVDIQEIFRLKANVVENFMQSLQPILKDIIGSNENSFEDVQEIYQGLEPEDILAKLKTSSILEAENIDNLNHFNSDSLNHLVKTLLRNPVDWHIFYVLFLNLDDVPVGYLAALHQISHKSIRHKRDLFQTHLVNIFRNGHLDGSSYHTAAHLEGVHSLDSLIKLYDHFHRRGGVKYLKEQLYSTLRNSKYYENENLEDITWEKIQFYFQKALKTDLKKHLFLSFFLRLDQAELHDFKERYTYTKESNILKHRNVINKELLALVYRDTKYDHALMISKEHVKNPLDLDELKGIYAAIPEARVVSRMIANLYQLPSSRHYSPEEIKQFRKIVEKLTIEDVHEFVYFQLKDHIIRWNLFLSDMLGAIELNREHLSKISYYPSVKAMGGERKRMVDALLSIITRHKFSHHPKLRPLRYEALTIEQVRDMYDGMTRREKIKRIIRALLEDKSKSHAYPRITEAHLKYFTKRYLNTALKERVFYSEFLRLDYTDYPQQWPSEYQSHNKKTILRRRSDIKNQWLALLAAPHFPDSKDAVALKALPILHKLTKQYFKLSSQEVLERIRNSYIFEGYSEAVDYLSVDTVNEFMKKTLNNRSHLEISQFIWHLYFCEVLKLCNKMDRREYLTLHALSHKDLVYTYRYTIKKNLLYLIYRDNQGYQDLINNDPNSSSKKVSLLNAVRHHPFLANPDPNAHIRLGFSYLNIYLDDEHGSKDITLLGLIHQMYANLTDSQKLFLLKDAKILIFSSPNQSQTKLHTHGLSLVHHLDQFMVRYLVEDDLHLHIFYALVLNIDESSPQDISALYGIQNSSEVVTIANALKAQLAEYFNALQSL